MNGARDPKLIRRANLHPENLWLVRFHKGTHGERERERERERGQAGDYEVFLRRVGSAMVLAEEDSDDTGRLTD